MQYLYEIPVVSSIGVEGDVIELELEQRVEEMPDLGQASPVVLLAKYAGQIVVTAGEVIEIENFEGPHTWCRIKIKGTSVTFTI